MTEYAANLRNEIDQLVEFLFDDYGDTVEQLGIEETKRLEDRLLVLRSEYRDYLRDEGYLD